MGGNDDILGRIMLYLNVSVLILMKDMIILCFEKLLTDDNLMMISNTILTVSKQHIYIYIKKKN